MTEKYRIQITEDNIDGMDTLMRVCNKKYKGFTASWNLHIGNWFYYPQFSINAHSTQMIYENTKEISFSEIRKLMLKESKSEPEYNIFN